MEDIPEASMERMRRVREGTLMWGWTGWILLRCPGASRRRCARADWTASLGTVSASGASLASSALPFVARPAPSVALPRVFSGFVGKTSRDAAPIAPGGILGGVRASWEEGRPDRSGVLGRGNPGWL